MQAEESATTTLEDIREFFAREFPRSPFELLEVSPKAATIRQPIQERHLRIGGTVSGPTLMAVADAAAYVATLANKGLLALAVTTNLNINFLRKPAADRAIIGECKLMKTGKVLVVGDVFLYSEGEEDPVAHAVVTYSIPPQGSAAHNWGK